MSRMNFFRISYLIIRRFYILFSILFLLIIIALVGYFYTGSFFYFKSDNTLNTLVEKVGKLVFLPQGEIPTIAKVSNPEVLRDQVFFVEAKTGDVVLIYSNAKKAFLYDPKANKIVNMSTINIGGTQKTEIIVPPSNTQLQLPNTSGETKF